MKQLDDPDVFVSYAHADRDQVNLLVAALTAEDLRTYANKYFTDVGRVTVTLSNSATMSGVDSLASIDETVAATSKTDIPVQPSTPDGTAASVINEEAFTASGENVPVSIVANQSASSGD